MRAVVLGAALLICGSLMGSIRGRAQPTEDASLTFATPAPLTTDQRAELSLELTPPPGGRAWMITLRSEGTAVEVVRGRLLATDAVDANARPLELRVPIVARSPGVGIVHAELSGWRCAESCEAVSLEASVTLHVSGRPHS